VEECNCFWCNSARTALAKAEKRADVKPQGLQRFWMVIDLGDIPGGTRVRHNAFKSASDEATRLAIKYPGRTFVVLTAQWHITASAPSTREEWFPV
jgi:hypothetical protein